MSCSVGELVEMEKALSEEELEQQFQQHFQGELGQLASYLEAVRKTLHSLSSSADGSKEFDSESLRWVAEINREAESGFNSVWEVIEEMQSDQSPALLGSGSDALNDSNVAKLQTIIDKNNQSLLRQRPEKVQRIIAKIEEKTIELSVKFKVKSHEKTIKEGDGAGLDQQSDLDQNLVDQLASLRLDLSGSRAKEKIDVQPRNGCLDSG